MAPSTSRLPNTGDTSLADTPMADGNEDAANQQHGGNLDDSMVVSAQTSGYGRLGMFATTVTSDVPRVCTD